MKMAQNETQEIAVVDVLAPVAVDTLYSYRVPHRLALEPGDSVTIPLGAREAYGVVWDCRTAPLRAAGDLKSVSTRLDRPRLSQQLRDFIDWLARYTLTPRGMALRLATRAAEDAAPDTLRTLYRVTGAPVRRLTPTRARVLEAAASGLMFSKKNLTEAAGCSSGVIDALVDDGSLEVISAPQEPLSQALDPDHLLHALEPAQSLAAARLTQAVEAKNFHPFLLEGVTGSGKTEVYFEAVAAALRGGGQALVMMPEIALTVQFLDRFTARFGAAPAEWHSGVSTRKRARIWRAAATGDVSVVIGARSALFLPFKNLRVIVVDEEHESAYKQDDVVAYHARDMAVVRARLEKATIVLASATPSIETRVNAQNNRYGYLQLESRVGARSLPQLDAIDMRREGPDKGKWIAPKLALAVSETLARKEQALLFLNRRGYAPLTLCRVCGHRFRCENCDAWLVEHRFRRALVCHHCGHIEKRPETCPNCASSDSLTACGPGVERVAEEAATLFPDARILVLSSDFPGGAERLRRELAEIANGGCDIVIGTQLVAKGHNFPSLTLVGVIDADLGLENGGDPRAAERTFQLLRQVTGRAGRGDKAGRALLQSFQPEHPVMTALLSGNADKFYAQEVRLRQRAGLPPFGRLAALIVSATDAASALTHARALARISHELPETPRYRIAQHGCLPAEDEIILLGPAEAPISLIRGRYRFRLLAKAPRNADIQSFLRDLFAKAPKARGGIRVQVDIDPQNFF